MTRPRVLIADDKENILSLFRKLLEPAGYEVVTAQDGRRALALASVDNFDVVVSDIRMPGADGFEVLRELKRSQPDVEVILMTAYGSVPKAVEAMKEGAYDYLTKPFDPDEALIIIGRAVERKQLREQARNLRQELEHTYRFDRLLGRSPKMQQVFGLLHRATKSDATVLLTGESGTGKELAARAVHFASVRKDRRFVPINCGALPENLIESELFGHVKGAFTGAVSKKTGLFEEADGGTLFLDEIGELPLAVQVKLNRGLQEGAIRPVGGTEERTINTRVVAATNLDLKEAVRAGRFREDLFYRLNVFPILLPPLRHRREDIPILAAQFIERCAKDRERPLRGFSADALQALVQYDWPGNVRELENAIERAAAVCDGSRIEIEDLPADLGPTKTVPSSNEQASQLRYRQVVDLARDRASREYLSDLMHELGGQVTKAAELAGMERESLHRLLKRYGIKPEDYKSMTNSNPNGHV